MALDGLVDVVARDFLWSWYRPLVTTATTTTATTATSDDTKNVDTTDDRNVNTAYLTMHQRRFPSLAVTLPSVDASPMHAVISLMRAMLSHCHRRFWSRFSLDLASSSSFLNEERFDIASFLSTRLVPILISHLATFKKSTAVVASLKRHPHNSEAYHAAVAAQYRVTAPDNAHPALRSPRLPHDKHNTAAVITTSTKDSEMAYLTAVLDKILPLLMPPASYTPHGKQMMPPRLLVILLRDILANHILYPLFLSLADPDYWNQCIDLWCGNIIRDAKMVHKLREALQQTIDDRNGQQQHQQHPKSPTFSYKRPKVTFEQYLKTIDQCVSLLELKGIKDSLDAEIEKKQHLIHGREDKEIVHGVKVEDMRRYMNQLMVARKRCDKKCESLGASWSDLHLFVTIPPKQTDDFSDTSLDKSDRLRMVLDGPAMMFFRGYLEKFKCVGYAVFWQTVEEIQKRAFDGDPADRRHWSDIRQEIQLLAEEYLQHPSPTFQLDAVRLDVREAIFDRLETLSTTKDELAFRVGELVSLMVEAHRDVFNVMRDEYLDKFCESDFYAAFLDQTSPVHQNLPVPEKKKSVLDTMFKRKKSPSPASSVSSNRAMGVIGTLFSDEKTRSFSSAAKEELLQRYHSHSSNSTTSILSRITKISPSDSPTTAPASASGIGTATGIGTGRGGNEGSPRLSPDPITKSTLLNALPSLPDPLPSNSTSVSVSVLGPVAGSSSVPTTTTTVPKITLTDTTMTTTMGTRDTKDVEAIEAMFERILKRGETDDVSDESSGSESEYEEGEEEEEIEEQEEEDEEEEREEEEGEEGFETDAFEDGDDGDEVKGIGSRDDHVMLKHYGTEIDVSPVSTVTDHDPKRTVVEEQFKAVKNKLDILGQQDAMLDIMIAKAKRPVSDAEVGLSDQLRLFKKMKWQFERERAALEMQKAQLELQLSENVIVPGKTEITISSWSIGNDPQKKEASRLFIVFVIEVSQKPDPNKTVEEVQSSGWIIARRYSEFDQLHKQLKAKFPQIMQQYELPGKRYLHHLNPTNRLRANTSGSQNHVLSTELLSKKDREFMDQRRESLQRYLRQLCRDQVVARSWEFRQFLCQENFNKMSAMDAMNRGLMQVIHLFGTDGTFIPGMVGMKKLVHSLTSPNQDKEKGKKKNFVQNLYKTITESFEERTSPTKERSLSHTTQTPTDDSHSKMVVDPSSSFRQKLKQKLSKGDLKGNPTLGRRASLPSMGVMNYIGHKLFHREHENATSTRSTSSAFTVSRLSPDMSPQTKEYYHHKIQVEVEAGLASSVNDGFQLQDPIHENVSDDDSDENDYTSSSMTEPLCDLFIEAFDLKEKNNWLRRQAVLIILQQVLGGTIERRLIETTKWLFSEDMVLYYISKIHEAVTWQYPTPPTTDSNKENEKGHKEEQRASSSSQKQRNSKTDNVTYFTPTESKPSAKTGGLKPMPVVEKVREPSQTPNPKVEKSASVGSKPVESKPDPPAAQQWVPRTDDQKRTTYLSASKKLHFILPDMLGPMTGRSNAKKAASRILDMVQNERLNKEIIYNVFDEFVKAYVPEIPLDTRRSNG